MKTVTLYTTSKCNIRCKHCGVGLDQDNPRSQQTTNDLKKVISELEISIPLRLINFKHINTSREYTKL